MIMLIFAIVVQCVAAAPMQDVNESAELFRWFPAGEYEQISHFDVAALNQAKGYELYAGFFEKYGKRWQLQAQLPEEFYPAIDSFTSTIMLAPKLRIVSMKRSKKKDDEAGKDSLSTFTETAEARYEVGRGARLAVYRGVGLAEAVRSAAKKNILAATGQSIDTSPVYQFATAFRGERREYYGWLSPDGDFLTSEDERMLAAMAATGRGELACIIDEPDYADVPELIENFGQEWNLIDVQAPTKMQLEAMIERGEDQAEITALEERIASGYRYFGSSIGVDKVITTFQIQVYPNDEAAEAGLADARGQPRPAEITDPQKLMNSVISYRREGAMVLGIIPIDQDYIDTYFRITGEKK